MKPEVLAPVGGWDQLKAAVASGADAVYFGVTDGRSVNGSFNARARASNFEYGELGDVVDFLKAYGVKGFACVNVLVFENELDRVADCLRELERAGVDAVIVQDFGVMRLAREVAPGLKVHASTQSSVCSAPGARHARSLGAERVVLGRELSLGEIARVSRELDDAPELEVFVHGALCVSYSGQCFSSEAWGGRSANRGQCAQACRLEYGMIVDGRLKSLSDLTYLLSPQDLAALDLVPDLMDAGVTSLKIEGRLKGPEYVAATTRAYREAVDAAWEGREAAWDEERRSSLAQLFARGQDSTFDGLSQGFLVPDHQKVVIGRSPRHRGVYIGVVASVNRSRGTVCIEMADHPSRRELKPSDGLVFDKGRARQEEAGGTIVQVIRRREGLVEVGFRRRAVDLGSVEEGDLVWRNKDPALEREIRKTVASGLDSRKDGRRVPVDVEVSGREGEPLEIRIAAQGQSASAKTELTLEAARNQGLTADSVARAIGELGGTGWRRQSLSFLCEPNLFIPQGEIKKARREAVRRLEEACSAAPDRASDAGGAQVTGSILNVGDRIGVPPPAASIGGAGDPGSAWVANPNMVVLCRSPNQVDPLLDLDHVREIILDFLSMDGLKESVARVAEAGKTVVVALPRIQKPGEENLLKSMAKLSDHLLVRSTAQLETLSEVAPGKTLYGDFSLNVANSLTASDLLLRYPSLARITPTHDLNARQITEMTEKLEGAHGKVEVILHHHLPIFHTEHCVFCRFLSDGSSKADCGQPCEQHSVHLRDSLGAEHLVLADQGCRNTVFNAAAQSGAAFLGGFLRSGIGTYRIELADEREREVAGIVESYHDLLCGRMSAEDLLDFLEKVPDSNGRAQGVTAGSLEVKKDRSKASMKKTAHQSRR